MLLLYRLLILLRKNIKINPMNVNNNKWICNPISKINKNNNPIKTIYNSNRIQNIRTHGINAYYKMVLH